MAAGDEHLQALLKLPLEDRAHAAKLLLDSLDDESLADEDADRLQTAELARRAREVTTGTATLIDSGEVQRRIAARLRAIRGQ